MLPDHVQGDCQVLNDVSETVEHVVQSRSLCLVRWYALQLMSENAFMLELRFHKLLPCDHSNALDLSVFRANWVTFVRHAEPFLTFGKKRLLTSALFRFFFFLKTTDFRCHTLDRSCDAGKNTQVLTAWRSRGSTCGRISWARIPACRRRIFNKCGGMLASYQPHRRNYQLPHQRPRNRALDVPVSFQLYQVVISDQML